MFIRQRKNPKTGTVYRSYEERYWCPITKKVKSRYLGTVDDRRGDDILMEEINKQERALKEQGDKGEPLQNVGPNDRLRLTDKATGVSAQRIVTKVLPDGVVVVQDDISGIPYKLSRETTEAKVIRTGNHEAPPPQKGFTFKELAELESHPAWEIMSPGWSQAKFLEDTGNPPAHNDPADGEQDAGEGEEDDV